MTSKYYCIYNVSRGTWAYNLSGDDDATILWRANNWVEGEALVGFWLGGGQRAYTVIHCPAGHVIYVSGDVERDEPEYHLEESTYHVPIAILVNLNNQFDTKFLRRKGEPAWWGEGSASDCEPESDCESESMVEEKPVKEKRGGLSETPQVELPGGKRIQASNPTNQTIIDFLYRCYDATSNIFKKRAYARALDYIGSHWADLATTHEVSIPCLFPKLSENMIRKICEFLDGVPEEDIINS